MIQALTKHISRFGKQHRNFYYELTQEYNIGAQTPTLAYFRQVRSSHCHIESSVPLSAQYEAEYPTSYLLLKQYSLYETDLLTH